MKPVAHLNHSRDLLLATLPALTTVTWFFGPGKVFTIALGTVFTLFIEILVMRLKGRYKWQDLCESKIFVSPVLLCLAIPPYAPWWLILIGVASSILIGKHAFGGISSPFNPAMVGYAVLLVSFPMQMTSWVSPRGVSNLPSFIETIDIIFLNISADSITSATPLDLFKQSSGLMFVDFLENHPELNSIGGIGWVETNIAFLVGGLWLNRRGVFSLHSPFAMLFTMAVCSFVGFDGGSSESGGGAIFHLFSGATMFSAFFILTDPSSSPKCRKGQLFFGSLIGILVYLIRVLGEYPDGFAFAILIMNFCTPFIDSQLEDSSEAKGYAQK